MEEVGPEDKEEGEGHEVGVEAGEAEAPVLVSEEVDHSKGGVLRRMLRRMLRRTMKSKTCLSPSPLCSLSPITLISCKR